MLHKKGVMILKCLHLVYIMINVQVVNGNDGHTCYCVKQELDKLRNPIHMEAVLINGEQVYFVAEQNGYIHQYKPSGVEKLSTYIDIHDRIVVTNRFIEERGLLGFALHPDFSTNSRIFLYTIRKLNDIVYAVISEIQDQKVDKEKTLLWIQQPSDRQNGGQLLFGRDGYLYVFIGDGGPATEAENQAQNGTSFLGKVLRLDVSTSVVIDNKLQYYTVPNDNPKYGDWRPEVYAIGGRNMWRCTVDKGDDQGRIFCGDLGSKYFEELNIIEKGGNYGWNIKEGRTCLKNQNCSVEGEVQPIQVFNHTNGDITAIVGGPLYRGSEFPTLYGQLVFGDFASGNIYTLKQEKNADGNKWTTHTFPQCHVSQCGCDVRDIRRTHLLSMAEIQNGQLFLLMTDELNPYSPRGALLSLHKPSSESKLTCGSVEFRMSLVLMYFIFLLYEIL